MYVMKRVEAKAMRNKIVILICLMLIGIGFLSGCTSDNDDNLVSCPLCSGRGYFQYSNAGTGWETVTENCPRCGGSGKVSRSSFNNPPILSEIPFYSNTIIVNDKEDSQDDIFLTWVSSRVNTTIKSMTSIDNYTKNPPNHSYDDARDEIEKLYWNTIDWASYLNGEARYKLTQDVYTIGVSFYGLIQNIQEFTIWEPMNMNNKRYEDMLAYDKALQYRAAINSSLNAVIEPLRELGYME